MKIRNVVVMIVLAALVTGTAGCAYEDPSASLSESIPVVTADAETVTEAVTEAVTIADVTAPVISGVHDITVQKGSSIVYKDGIEVTDDTDPDPELSIDSSNVDIGTVGIYEVVYTATDESGNYTQETATISVVEREVISLDRANALADSILNMIIEEGMSTYEKLEAVWWYIHDVGYVEVDYGEVDSYIQNAYYYLTTRQGDCRCVYGASRLLLERLGYQTHIIYNKEDAFVMHYWNLVSTDGGCNWYHFDPTIWDWDEYDDDVSIRICMDTDEELLEYSGRYDNHSHNWDPSLFPAVSTVPYDKGW